MKKSILISMLLVLALSSLAVTLVLAQARLQGRDDNEGNLPQLAAVHSPRNPSDTLPEVDISIDEVIASGFSRPIQVTHAGDGSGRLFVVEQTGKIRIIKDGVLLSTPFIDLSSQVACCGEQGLLGVAFHPNYGGTGTGSGTFFVNYSRSSDGDTVIARYSVSAGDPDQADHGSTTTLLTIDQPYANHNGGQLLFSPVDGYLYIGMGDGGSGGDPLDSGQNINTLLGAMLRIDVNSGTPYSIPPDNPFVGEEGEDEIWVYGLRNPWRFSFDRSNGDLYIGDVGQGAWEEISYQDAGTSGGVNFGWRCKEGTHDYNFDEDCAAADLTDPIAEYSHSEGYSVTGGFVYRGSFYTALVGRYFYADYVEGKIWSLYKTGTSPDTWSTPTLELDTGLNISCFGEDEAGEMYVCDYSGGTVRQLVDANHPSPDLSSSAKLVSSSSADPSEVLTYTIWLTNTGGLADVPVTLTDTLPSGLYYVPGSFGSDYGVTNDASAPILSWSGNLDLNLAISMTYQAQVTGLVTGSIINEAIVKTATDPAFSLYQSVSVPRSVLTTTVADFSFPGTQPGDLTQPIQTSVDCDICHSEPIYDRWRGSLMSQSGRDPLMWAALHVANNDAPNAGEYCLRCHTPKGWYGERSHPPDGSALQGEDISSGVACALCHRMVDPVASTTDEAVTIDEAIRAALAEPVPEDFQGSGAIIIDPEDHRRGPFTFSNALPYHSSYQTDFLSQTGEALTRSRFCGSCHNVYNPVLSWDPVRGEYWPNEMDAPPASYDGEDLFPIETTFDEWLYSDFAQGGVYAPQFAGEKTDGIVETCQDCHMTRSTGIAADPAFNPVDRDCQTTGCLPEHGFIGANAWVPGLLQDPAWRLSSPIDQDTLQTTISLTEDMLRKAATISVTLTTTDTGKVATVWMVNHTGHKLPTGYPEGRQMWVNLVAYDPDGEVVFESGAYDQGTGTLTRDAHAKVYEVKQGLTADLAGLLGKSAGESFHFVLNNTVVKDNRIPPQGYTVAQYDRPGLRPVGATYADGQYWDEIQYLLPAETDLVHATLYYQTSSREYIDFLVHNGGVDGISLRELWQESKSPPVPMAGAWSRGFQHYFPSIFGMNLGSQLQELAGWMWELISQ